MVLFTIIALTILVLGPDITGRNLYPSYMLAKINIGNFLQRIEAVMAVMWFITLFYRISLYFYAIAIGISQIFHIKTISLWSFHSVGFWLRFPSSSIPMFHTSWYGTTRLDSVHDYDRINSPAVVVRHARIA